MGKRFTELSEQLSSFIAAQKIFFVGTATDNSRVNVSPKGTDSLRVLSPTRVIWLNMTGSGNESAAHVQLDPRMTIMFCAFEGPPLILRLYGKARVIHHNDADWTLLAAHFPPQAGARQVFDLAIDLVQTSCGMATPYYQYVGERELLADWATRQGSEGIRKYWHDRNQHSIDGIETHIQAKNL